jgi:hypothetical protein
MGLHRILIKPSTVNLINQGCAFEETLTLSAKRLQALLLLYAFAAIDVQSFFSASFARDGLLPVFARLRLGLSRITRAVLSLVSVGSPLGR